MGRREKRPWEVAVRESISRHLDLVFVIWVLTLAVGFSLVSLSRANLTADQWSSAPQSGPVWEFPSQGPAQ
jgi:hypothetical protein